jgi:hypothetical protein
VLHAGANEVFGNPFDITLTGEGTALSDTGDADHDGTANMLEDATGSDPLTPTPPPGTLVKSGGTLEFTFNRRTAALAATPLTVEWSDGLTDTWTTLDDSTLTLLNDDGVLQTVRYTLPAGAGRRFVRLRATRVPGP